MVEVIEQGCPIASAKCPTVEDTEQGKLSS